MFFFFARKYSFDCILSAPVKPSGAQTRLGDGRSVWNLTSMREGGPMPSIAVSSSLLFLAGSLFPTVWHLALSLCQLTSHFSLNIQSDPSPFFCLFMLKKFPNCYPVEADLMKSSCGKTVKFAEVLRRVWHFLKSWTVLLPSCQAALLPDHIPNACIWAFAI